jgi:hypothetical protein
VVPVPLEEVPVAMPLSPVHVHAFKELHFCYIYQKYYILLHYCRYPMVRDDDSFPAIIDNLNIWTKLSTQVCAQITGIDTNAKVDMFAPELKNRRRRFRRFTSVFITIILLELVVVAIIKWFNYPEQIIKHNRG